MTNPLLAPFDRPFGLPPFDAIAPEHFPPAFEAAFAEARAKIGAIRDNEDAPTFANTIEAMELAEEMLDRVAGVFFNLAGTDSTPEIEAIARDWSPRFAAFSSEILMDKALFARVDAVAQGDEPLSGEQRRVLELYRAMFVRAGAELDASGQARLAEIMQRLAALGTQFSQNVLAEEREWRMELSCEDMEGCPRDLIVAAREAARERGLDGYVITMSRSLIEPFLTFSTRRDLRERAYTAWTSRCGNGGETDNRALVAEILALREERARLLGFESFAAFKLDKEMAREPAAVRTLLMQVWEPAKAAAERDAARLAALAGSEGAHHPFAAWDWRHYAEKLRKREHDFDAGEVKPYLALDNMIAAAFDVAGRLFGLEFAPVEAKLHHPDARAWEVTRDGRHLGLFIGDWFARSSKRSGAWCSRFRGQSGLGEGHRPLVLNVCNFAKGDPALLTWDDARTLFHEFGHALHSLLSDVTYPFVSGTSVARDFVELPSQLYEHWLGVPEVLRTHARHHETDEPIPEELVAKIRATETFGMGFATVEYLASALVDLDFHDGPAPADPMQAQAETLDRIGMPEAISMRHAAPHFQHVFSGDGYSSGYYSYMWSEVMDADAFAAFEETGDPFDKALAERLATHVYAAGGSRAPEDLYTAFRGRMPGPEALLKGRGLAA
ncbi:MAG: M3 family metallopeptidase [Rubricella sp.]